MGESTQFLTGIVAHLETFAKTHGRPASEVYVRITTADGRAIVLTNFTVRGAHGGWGMAEGLWGGAPVGLVVRETHVIKAEFELVPDQPLPFGFQAAMKE